MLGSAGEPFTAKFLVRRLSANFTTLTRKGSAPGIAFAAWRIADKSALQGCTLGCADAGAINANTPSTNRNAVFMAFSGARGNTLPALQRNFSTEQRLCGWAKERHQVGAAGEVQEEAAPVVLLHEARKVIGAGVLVQEQPPDERVEPRIDPML